MAKQVTKLAKEDWHTIDPNSLPPSIKAAHDAYKAAYKAAKEAREGFEALMSKAIDPAPGKRVVFGYNFGKLSVAIADDDTPTAKPTPKALSLADLCRR